MSEHSNETDAPGSRTILHVDMDAFFAAIEVRDNPEYAGKPLVVGSPPDRRGVVSTASYEARQFGIHSGMPSRTAGKLCPHAIFVPPRMRGYSEVSQALSGIFSDYTPFVEKISVDEAFMDVTGVLHMWEDAGALARDIKQRIRDDLKLTGSVGVAPNKFLAKLASDLQKPDGLTMVPFDTAGIRDFLAPLEVTRIWGVGKTAARKLHALGIHRVEHLQQRGEDELVRLFGESGGGYLWRLSRGIDARPVNTERIEKSISNENTFGEDERDLDRVAQVLHGLTEKVAQRLRQSGKRARTGSIKVRFSDFKTITRQTALTPPADTDRRLLSCANALFTGVRESEAKALRGGVRLVGFGVSNLCEPGEGEAEPMLFRELEAGYGDERDQRLDQAVDALREQFGKSAVKRTK